MSINKIYYTLNLFLYCMASSHSLFIAHFPNAVLAHALHAQYMIIHNTYMYIIYGNEAETLAEEEKWRPLMKDSKNNQKETGRF